MRTLLMLSHRGTTSPGGANWDPIKAKRVASYDAHNHLLACAARPELKSRDFFVTGESYGGHYIPVVGHFIWRTNQAKAEDERINLKGLAIGNGLCACSGAQTDQAAFCSSPCQLQINNTIVSGAHHAALCCAMAISTLSPPSALIAHHTAVRFTYPCVQHICTVPCMFLVGRTVPEIQFGAYSVYAQQKGLITAAQAAVLQMVPSTIAFFQFAPMP